jgi:DNA polymerase I-like protein with 3'-5' exonuclease and polymerase domains
VGVCRCSCGLVYTNLGATSLEAVSKSRLNSEGEHYRDSGADGLKLALALLWERRRKCPGAVSVLICHDEVVVECHAGQAADAKAWLEKAIIDGMDAILNSTGEVHVPVEVESRVASSWGEG